MLTADHVQAVLEDAHRHRANRLRQGRAAAPCVVGGVVDVDASRGRTAPAPDGPHLAVPGDGTEVVAIAGERGTGRPTVALRVVDQRVVRPPHAADDVKLSTE